MLKNEFLNPIINLEYKQNRLNSSVFKMGSNASNLLTFDYVLFNKKEKKIEVPASTKGLFEGDYVNNFIVTDHTGKKQELYDLLSKGKVVVVFYRGQWCPVCMPFVRKLQSQLMELYVRGVSVLLITPEKQENIQKTQEKTNTTISVIHDKDYRLMKLFDVAFIPSRVEKFMYNIMFGAGLRRAHSDTTQTLPVPATFLINQDKTIGWRHFDKNFKTRANIKELIKNI